MARRRTRAGRRANSTFVATAALALAAAATTAATARAARLTGVYATAATTERESVHVDELVRWVVDAEGEEQEEEESGRWVSLEVEGEEVGTATAGAANALEYTFARPGAHEVTARLWTKNGTLEDTLSTHLQVEEATDFCVEFYAVEGDIVAPNTNATLHIAARFLRSSGEAATMGFTDEDVTRELLEMGETPHVRIHGEEDFSAVRIVSTSAGECWDEVQGDEIACVRVQPSEAGWTIDVAAEGYTGTTWLSVESSSSSSFSSECNVRPTRIPILVASLAASFQDSARDAASEPAALSLQSQDKRMHLLVGHTCVPNIVAGLVTDQGYAKTLIVSYDGFLSSIQIELALMSVYDSSQDTVQALCSVIECDSLHITNMAFLDDNIVFLTTSQGPIAIELIGAVGRVHTLALSGLWEVTGKTHCRGEVSPATAPIGASALRPRVYLQQDEDAVEVYVDIEETTGATIVVVTDLGHLSDPFETRYGHTLLSTMACTAEMNMLLLLYRSNADPGVNFIGHICDGRTSATESPGCYDTLDDGRAILKPKLGYVFPDNADLTGMCAHLTGLALFAYGNGLWISFDGAYHFEQTLRLDDGEQLEDCPVSSATKSVYFVKTTRGRVFMGKLHVKGLIPIYEELGADKHLRLASDNAAYWVRWTPAKAVERFSIPLATRFATYTHEPGASQWAVSAPHGSRIALACISKTTGQVMNTCFGPQHEGMVVAPLMAHVYDVDLSTGFAYAKSSVEISTVPGIAAQPCALRIVSNESLATVCSSEDTRPPLFVSLLSGASAETAAGCLSHLQEGASIFLSARQGGVALALLTNVTEDAAGTAYCAFGEFPTEEAAITEVVIGSSQWSALASSHLQLSFPKCAEPALYIRPNVMTPVVRTLDKYDLFVWRGLVADQRAEKNRAVEEASVDGLFWTENNDSLRIIRSRPALTTAYAHHSTNMSASATEWSTRASAATFATYGLVRPTATRHVSSVSGTHSFIVLIEPTGLHTSSVTTVLMSSVRVNLACAVDAFESVARLFVSCPTAKDLSYVPAEDATYTSLPVNYRPPSERGKGIPLTPNVYNADPSQPLYMDWYRVSRESAQFKQCAGATSRTDCNCSSYASLAADKYGVEVSDCIVKVQRLLYSEYFVPSFVLSSILDAPATPLNSTYQIRDVNGRVDFCTNATDFDTSACGETSAINSFGMNPSLYDAILFVGEGLFHFEVTIQDPISFCELKTYVLLYVEEPPLTPREESTTIAVTAIFLLVFGIFSYIAYSFWNRDQDLDQREPKARA